MITKREKKQDDGRHLHSIRKAAADKVSATGAFSYLQRIEIIAAGLNIKYKGISDPNEFWEYLLSLPDRSISRIWYSGHAGPSDLMLSLTHDTDTCRAEAKGEHLIRVSDIAGQGSLKKKFVKNSKYISKFYGCYTEGFAEKWNSVFGVSAAGAKKKISFDLDRPSKIVNILERIEQTSTTEGAPD